MGKLSKKNVNHATYGEDVERAIRWALSSVAEPVDERSGLVFEWAKAKLNLGNWFFTAWKVFVPSMQKNRLNA